MRAAKAERFPTLVNGRRRQDKKRKRPKANRVADDEHTQPPTDRHTHFKIRI